MIYGIVHLSAEYEQNKYYIPSWGASDSSDFNTPSQIVAARVFADDTQKCWGIM